MTNLDHWDRFINGSSREAAIMFADLYAESGDKGDLNNLILALLDDENYELAREMSDTAIRFEVEEKSIGEGTYVMRGLIDWFTGKPKCAVDLWRLALDAVYADEAGGVEAPSMLWYAGYRLGDPLLEKEGRKLLSKFRLGVKAQTFNRWPGPRGIASYILGEVDASTLLNKWKWPRDGTLEVRRLCRANFWVGVKSPDPKEKREFFRTAVSDKNAILESEYFLAKWELRDLDKKL